MSKIIYRKIRTAPGVKQYLDEEKTQVNPQFEASSAYYAQAVTIETMSLRDMAKHITSHGSPFTMDVVIGVLEAFRSCLIEQLLESKKVKVQGLGTFYVTIANKEGGIKNLEDFNIGTLATGLRLRFLPEGATEESISSKDFLKKSSPTLSLHVASSSHHLCLSRKHWPRPAFPSLATTRTERKSRL